MGLFKIAGYLKKNGIGCDVLDYDIDDDRDFLTKAASGTYAVIGMSVTHFQMESDLERLWKFRKVAESSGLPTVIAGGGQEATMNYEQWLNAALDIVFFGFAEETYFSFCQRVLKCDVDKPKLDDLADGLNGVAYFDNHKNLISRAAVPLTKEKFSELFFDNIFDLDVPYEKYWQHLRKNYTAWAVGGAGFIFEHVRIYGTSHCPRRCGFCSSQTFLPFSQEPLPKIIMLDAEQYVKLIVYHFQKFGARMVTFSDDDFLVGSGVGAKRAIDVAKGILREKQSGNLPQDFKFHFQARIADVIFKRQLNTELLDSLAEAGCIGFSVGVETFSEKLLKSPSINKVGITVKDCRWVLDAMLERVLVPQINVILGAPETNVEDLVETIMAAAEYVEKGADIALVTRVEVYPGAPLAKNPDYPYHNRIWTNPYTGDSVEISDYFQCWDPVIDRMCEGFNEAKDQELHAIKQRFGWEGQTVHKRIVAFANLIAVGKLLRRPDIVERIDGLLNETLSRVDCGNLPPQEASLKLKKFYDAEGAIAFET
jgi:radical SAM superfamily enzyme YgiQ (UPF0313 family)